MKHIAILVTLIPLYSAAFAATQKAHVHGLARIALAIETPTTANIDLDVAGDSIMGFEHEARSEKDKKTMEESFNKLKTNASSILKFNPTLQCTVTVKEVGLEKAEAGSKHADVNASYTVSCAKPLNGSKVQVGLIGLFPKIKSATFEVLTSTGQIQQNVKGENEFITIP